MFHWIKRYLPKGLYGRVALILLLPIVMLQFLVSIVFVQRHFEGVTEQLTQSIRLEMYLLSGALRADNGLSERVRLLGSDLGITIQAYTESREQFQSRRRFYDLTGGIVARELSRLEDDVRIDLPNDDVVNILIAVGNAFYVMSFPRSRVSASNPHQLFVNMIVFGFIFTFIAFIYLRNQLRPITRLAKAADAFGKGQNVKYKPSGAVEVRAAGASFLEMRARIERHIEQRTLLLSGVSHDLGTPLTRLKLGLSMLEGEEKEALLRDVSEMEALLDEFLSFARGPGDSTGDMALEDLRHTVGEAVAAAKMISTNITLREGLPLYVSHRPLAIRRAVDNLVNNARRYGGSVLVTLERSQSNVLVHVEDDGPGIPAHKREDAVKPFTRLDQARGQNLGSGVGLGLPIVADIANAHGGQLLLAESERLGGLKATMTFAL